MQTGIALTFLERIQNRILDERKAMIRQTKDNRRALPVFVKLYWIARNSIKLLRGVHDSVLQVGGQAGCRTGKACVVTDLLQMGLAVLYVIALMLEVLQ